MSKAKKKSVAERIAEQLFEDGLGRQCDRLAPKTNRPANRLESVEIEAECGGWRKQGVIEVIKRELRKEKARKPSTKNRKHP